MKATVPSCEIEYADNAGPDKRCYRVDCSKVVRALPNFQPIWNAKAGARQLLEAYQKNELTLETFNGPTYKRIDHINGLLEAGKLNHQLQWIKRNGKLKQQPLASANVATL